MIIVDFRGFDTLGEITVLGIAALLVTRCSPASAPPRRRAPSRRSAAARRPARRPLMLETVGPVLLPLAAVVATWFFLRGHNQPGGGFIAGLTLALALLVPYHRPRQRLGRGACPADLQRWIGGGLAIAALTGVGSFAVGHPFLTSHYFTGTLPLVGEVPLATAVFFDLGVFLAVVGATLLALIAPGTLTGRRCEAKRADGAAARRAIGLLTAAGIYLMLRARTFDVVLGLTLLSYAVNLFIFAMGRLGVDARAAAARSRARRRARATTPTRCRRRWC